MHRESTQCSDLIKATLNALNNNTMQLLLLGVQQTNINLRTIIALKG